MAGERRINWGLDAADAKYRSEDTDPNGGDLVVAELVDTGTVLLQWDDTAEEWVYGGPVNMGGSDVTNVGSLSAGHLNNIREVSSADDLHSALSNASPGDLIKVVDGTHLTGGSPFEVSDPIELRIENQSELKMTDGDNIGAVVDISSGGVKITGKGAVNANGANNGAGGNSAIRANVNGSHISDSVSIEEVTCRDANNRTIRCENYDSVAVKNIRVESLGTTGSGVYVATDSSDMQEATVTNCTFIGEFRTDVIIFDGDAATPNYIRSAHAVDNLIRGPYATDESSNSGHWWAINLEQAVLGGVISDNIAVASSGDNSGSGIQVRSGGAPQSDGVSVTNNHLVGDGSVSGTIAISLNQSNCTTSGNTVAGYTGIGVQIYNDDAVLGQDRIDGPATTYDTSNLTDNSLLYRRPLQDSISTPLLEYESKTIADTNSELAMDYTSRGDAFIFISDETNQNSALIHNYALTNVDINNNPGSHFTTTQGNAGTVNVYENSGVRIENQTGGEITVVYVVIGLAT